MIKMAQSDWQRCFIDLLKFLETHGEPVREFRRSFEAGGRKERVYPNLNDLYEKCKDKLNENFVEWFNSQSFRIQRGLKIVILKCNTDKDLFEQYLRQLFSCWDSEINFILPEKLQPKAPIISHKKMAKAMKYMNNMNPKQLKQTASLASGNQIENLRMNPDVLALAEQMQDNPTAQSLARKLELNK